jgi:hypothetical protein
MSTIKVLGNIKYYQFPDEKEPIENNKKRDSSQDFAAIHSVVGVKVPETKCGTGKDLGIQKSHSCPARPQTVHKEEELPPVPPQVQPPQSDKTSTSWLTKLTGRDNLLVNVFSTEFKERLQALVGDGTKFEHKDDVLRFALKILSIYNKPGATTTQCLKEYRQLVKDTNTPWSKLFGHLEDSKIKRPKDALKEIISRVGIVINHAVRVEQLDYQNEAKPWAIDKVWNTYTSTIRGRSKHEIATIAQANVQHLRFSSENVNAVPFGGYAPRVIIENFNPQVEIEEKSWLKTTEINTQQVFSDEFVKNFNKLTIDGLEAAAIHAENILCLHQDKFDFHAAANVLAKYEVLQNNGKAYFASKNASHLFNRVEKLFSEVESQPGQNVQATVLFVRAYLVWFYARIVRNQADNQRINPLEALKVIYSRIKDRDHTVSVAKAINAIQHYQKLAAKGAAANQGDASHLVLPGNNQAVTDELTAAVLKALKDNLKHSVVSSEKRSSEVNDGRQQSKLNLDLNVPSPVRLNNGNPQATFEINARSSKSSEPLTPGFGPKPEGKKNLIPNS